VYIARSFILAGLVSVSGIAQQKATPNSAGSATTITRIQAETTAVKQNPRIAAGRLLALAEGQEVVRQRAAELPQIAGNLTAVQAEDGTRIGAGQLNSSRLYTHAGTGGTLSLLLTDFGHTSNLVASARLRAKAEQQNALATEQDVVFATDEAFYKLLTAQSLLDVARQTVTARRSARDLTQALAASKLKSELDLNTAAANLSQAELLQLDAENEVQQASAALAALLGESSSTSYKAIEDRGDVPLPPEGSSSIEKEAVLQRPDLRAAQLNTQAEEKFATAQARQNLPTISALTVGGVTPVRPDGTVFPENWYGGAGVNLSLPIFTGFRISAEAKEARLRAQAQEKAATDLSNNITRDVRTATLSAQTAFRKIQVADAFRDQTAQALSLAETRYKLGLSSIVELSQAQLQSTQAAVSAVNARFDYLLSLRSLDYAAGRIAP